ncbi:UV-B-induced protein At3g17800, chloroplastic-like [Curcuma longa]|uniref:UV-B-induced protein At3g17800, chloroplastic-like n=1 Tax=Curcuma longa TaxID=136217 RepID=UPI003D9EADE1
MEAAASLRSPQILYRTRGFGPRFSIFGACRMGFLSFESKPHLGFKGHIPIHLSKRGQQRLGARRSIVRASSSSFMEDSSRIAPLQLESPVGQFLSQILVNHPHLLPAAVEQQLEQLQTNREAEMNKEEPAPSGTNIVLYRRIAEVKANERKNALEEILYTLVVQKFVEADVSLAPAISQPDPSGRVDQWSSQDEKLEKLHSSEAYQMIKNHLALILGQRLGDSNSVAPISKLKVGQVYAASVMYGYFLKRVDQRFQLEKSMKILPWGSEEEESAIKQAILGESRASAPTHPEASSWSSSGFNHEGIGNGMKSSRLRSYVMSFDSDTLQRYATIRSNEAFNIIDKHNEALFGRPEIVFTPEGTIDSSKDELIKISFAGLRRLILEAVTFGSFLWDVESYVDSRYHFVTN